MAQGDRTSKRGFASMDEDKQREIARKGGASVPDDERSFSRDHELASQAGKKGGHESGGNFKNDPREPPRLAVKAGSTRYYFRSRILAGASRSGLHFLGSLGTAARRRGRLSAIGD